jgi:thioesterase domain-containing protein
MVRSLEDMASSYVKEMVSVQPKGPYNILGWSFGGALAFEIARQVNESGGEIGLLAFMDAAAPSNDALSEQASINEIDEKKLLQGIAHELNTIRRYSDLPPLDENAMTWQLAIDGYQEMGIVPKDYSVEDMRRKMLVYGNCGILFNQYRPPAIPVPIVHFQASQNSEDWDFDWRPYTTKNVRSIWIRCNHYRMGFEPNTTLVAAHLRALIRGDTRALGWWRRTPLANSMERIIGRLAS